MRSLCAVPTATHAYAAGEKSFGRPTAGAPWQGRRLRAGARAFRHSVPAVWSAHWTIEAATACGGLVDNNAADTSGRTLGDNAARIGSLHGGVRPGVLERRSVCHWRSPRGSEQAGVMHSAVPVRRRSSCKEPVDVDDNDSVCPKLVFVLLSTSCLPCIRVTDIHRFDSFRL